MIRLDVTYAFVPLSVMQQKNAPTLYILIEPNEELVEVDMLEPEAPVELGSAHVPSRTLLVDSWAF